MKTYTSADITELIRILHASGEVPDSELAGMDRLGALLIELENLSEGDIAKVVQRYFRSV